MDFVHKSVLLNECIDGLKIKPNGIYVDGTLGGAGHSSEIIKKLSAQGKLIGIDRDEDALKAAKERLKEYSNVIYYHGNHDDIKEILEDLNIEKVDTIEKAKNLPCVFNNWAIFYNGEYISNLLLNKNMAEKLFKEKI